MCDISLLLLFIIFYLSDSIIEDNYTLVTLVKLIHYSFQERSFTVKHKLLCDKLDTVK